MAQVPDDAVHAGLRRRASRRASRRRSCTRGPRRRSRRGSRAGSSRPSPALPSGGSGSRRRPAGSGRRSATAGRLRRRRRDRPPGRRYGERGWNTCSGRLAISGFSWCSGVRSSSTQNDRPCVATIRSSFLIARSVIGTIGRLSWNRFQRRAVVERDVHAALGAGVEQAGPLRVGADDAGEVVVLDPGRRSSSRSCRSRSSCTGRGGSRRACTASRRRRGRPSRSGGPRGC